MRLSCCVTLFFLGCTATSPQPAVAPAAKAPAPPSATQQANDQSVTKMMAGIAGRENEPAATVFKNIQIPWLKTIPAERFLTIMNYGYSHALGVTCTHCHEDDFTSDAKRPKRAAREMAQMHRTINQSLAKMENLKHGADDRSINCFVCHRGRIDPRESDN